MRPFWLFAGSRCLGGCRRGLVWEAWPGLLLLDVGLPSCVSMEASPADCMAGVQLQVISLLFTEPEGIWQGEWTASTVLDKIVQGPVAPRLMGCPA